MATIAEKSRTKEIIDRLQVIINNASPVPLAPGKVTIYKDEVQSLLTELASQMGFELKMYQEVNDRKGKIIKEAKKEAERIIYQAEHTASRMRVTRHTTNVAPLDYDTLDEEERNALGNANEIYGASLIYTDEMLTEVNNLIFDTYENIRGEYEIILQVLEDKMNMIAANREELMTGLQEMDTADRSQQILEIGQLLSDELYNARMKARMNSDEYEDGSVQLSFNLQEEREEQTKQAEEEAQRAAQALAAMTAERDALMATVEKMKREGMGAAVREVAAATAEAPQWRRMENREYGAPYATAYRRRDSGEYGTMYVNEYEQVQGGYGSTYAEEYDLGAGEEYGTEYVDEEYEIEYVDEDDLEEDEEYEIEYVDEEDLEEGEEYEIEYVDEEDLVEGEEYEIEYVDEEDLVEGEEYEIEYVGEEEPEEEKVSGTEEILVKEKVAEDRKEAVEKKVSEGESPKEKISEEEPIKEKLSKTKEAPVEEKLSKDKSVEEKLSGAEEKPVEKEPSQKIKEPVNKEKNKEAGNKIEDTVKPDSETGKEEIQKSGGVEKEPEEIPMIPHFKKSDTVKTDADGNEYVQATMKFDEDFDIIEF